MKAFVAGKRYDTETAIEICTCRSQTAYRSDFGWWEGELYRTKGGASRFAKRVDDHTHGSGSGIQPLTEAEALELAEANTDYETIEQHFGHVVEDARDDHAPAATTLLQPLAAIAHTAGWWQALLHNQLPHGHLGPVPLDLWVLCLDEPGQLGRVYRRPVVVSVETHTGAAHEVQYHLAVLAAAEGHVVAILWLEGPQTINAHLDKVAGAEKGVNDEYHDSRLLSGSVRGQQAKGPPERA